MKKLKISLELFDGVEKSSLEKYDDFENNSEVKSKLKQINQHLIKECFFCGEDILDQIERKT